jgi:flagellar basal body-associated protein FliL
LPQNISSRQQHRLTIIIIIIIIIIVVVVIIILLLTSTQSLSMNVAILSEHLPLLRFHVCY